MPWPTYQESALGDVMTVGRVAGAELVVAAHEMAGGRAR
jgi:hypothetical protein